MFSLADRIAEHVQIEDDAASVERLKQLPQQWRYIEPIVYYYNEVNNGGHHQYFWNSHGVFRGLVREGLDYYGASAYLKVFDQALAAYDPQMYEVERGATWEKFQAAYKGRRFDKQDDEFFGIDPDLAAILTSKVREGLAEE